MTTFSEKYGFWFCNGFTFASKTQALVYASKVKKPVRLVYHDPVWRSFNRSLLGRHTLDYLYKLRAQQLRDKYDYLILHYSGGADSNNVLETFIKNNIKLDEVCVLWPKALVDGKFYMPNINDRTAYNSWSEWNFAVKPSLEKLKQTNPEIKITVQEFLEDHNKIKIEPLFDKLRYYRPGVVMYNYATILHAQQSAHHNKGRVGRIYGIDKPLLAEWNNGVYMFFNDVPLSIIHESEAYPENAEAFYWSPDLPELAFEMAYKTSQYYFNNPDMRKFLWGNKANIDTKVRIQMQNDIVKRICYTTWDYRFQADKPTNVAKKDKWFWFFSNPDLAKLIDTYTSEIKNRMAGISDEFLDIESPDTFGVKTTITDLFFVRSL